MKFFCLCWRLVYFITSRKLCQPLFLIFLNLKFKKIKKRRRRDLNPRAALTTYTLSRGTSSASWVLLQSPNYLTNVKLWSCASFVAHLLLYLKDHFLSTSFLSFLFFYTNFGAKLCEYMISVHRETVTGYEVNSYYFHSPG